MIDVRDPLHAPKNLILRLQERWSDEDAEVLADWCEERGLRVAASVLRRRRRDPNVGVLVLRTLEDLAFLVGARQGRRVRIRQGWRGRHVCPSLGPCTGLLGSTVSCRGGCGRIFRVRRREDGTRFWGVVSDEEAERIFGPVRHLALHLESKKELG